MSWLLYQQVFSVAIYPSSRLYYWWTSYFIWKKLCEGTYLFPININSRFSFLQKNKSINKIVSLRKIINGNVKVVCYDSKDVVPLFLRSILQNCYNTFSLLHIPIKEHYIIMDENNLREGIKFDRYVSIGTQDTTYDYNDEFWDSI